MLAGKAGCVLLWVSTVPEAAAFEVGVDFKPGFREVLGESCGAAFPRTLA